MLILEDLNFTIKDKKKIEDKLDEVQRINWKLEEKLMKVQEENKKIEQEKMILEAKKMTMELQLADVADKYKCKTDENRTRMKNMKKYVIEKDMHLNYALGAIVILIIIIIAMYAISSCTR